MLLRLALIFGLVACTIGAKKKCESITIPLCKGIGYNMTSFPNSYGHEKQDEAGLEVHQFYPLVEVGCYQHLKFFLCTLYTPICQDNYEREILPCMEMCLEARSKCSPIMAKYGFRWPETLSCDVLPKMSDGQICAAPPDTPKKKHEQQETSSKKIKPEVGIFSDHTHAKDQQCECTCQKPFQYVASSKSQVGNVSGCAYSCHSPAFVENQGLINNWMAFWSITCCVLSTFTFLTFLIETDRFQYPERPIFMLAFCQLMVAVGFMIRYFVGHDEIACDTGFRIKGSDDNNSGSLCFVVFLLTYFFGMAASVWWVILSLTWVLAAASKWSSEAIASYSFHFHVIGWCLPAAQTVLVLVFNAIDGDPITGICYVGNTDLFFQRVFVLAPLVTYFVLGVMFLMIGFFNLWSIRNEVQKQHPSLDNAHKITQLMSKIGIFSLLYTIPSLLIISVMFYEQNHRQQWEMAQLCACSPGQTIADSSLILSLIKTCCMCIVGWTSGFWVCSTKTLCSWKNAICCLGQSRSSPKYQPADILYAKSDMSSPQFYNTNMRQTLHHHHHLYGDKL